ncbi:MAG TPA: MFS transporter [Myxococcota bacterium]|nr:MFS transporter [Myxococcota bacterium]
MNELLRAFRGPAGPVLLGCLVAQLGLGCVYFFGVTLKYVVSDFEWSRAQFAGSSVPLLLGYAIGSPLVGTLTDRLGGRRVMSGAAVLLAAAFVGIAGMEALWQFYALSLAMGVALVGLGDIPVAAVTARWVEKGRGLALGFVFIGSNLGGAVVPLAAVAIAERPGGSWRQALVAIAAGVLALIGPVVFWTVREPPPGYAPAPDDHEPESPDDPALDLAGALRTRSFWILFATLVFFYFYYLGVNHHLVAHLSDVGYSNPDAARGFAGAALVGVAGKLAIGLLADRISHKRALLLNFALMTFASAVLLAVDRPTLLLVFLVAHGFAVAAENVLIPLVVADCFGIRHMAQIYGVLMISLFVGGGLGPVFAGRVFDTLGSYEWAFLTYAGLNLATLALLAGTRDERVALGAARLGAKAG